LVFTYISLFANPIENNMDIKGALIFIISFVFLSAGLFFILKKNYIKVVNE